MFARILVPLDGSPLAEGILPEVSEVARLHGAEILLLRVALAHTFPGVDATDAQVHAVSHIPHPPPAGSPAGGTGRGGTRCWSRNG